MPEVASGGGMSKAGWMSSSLEERVKQALDEVRPALKADGGDVQLVAIADRVVKLRLLGACHGCPMASSTLADFVAERVRLWAPEIEDVVTV
jgi:Fe-S cluster biogenesis protein NfuA